MAQIILIMRHGQTEWNIQKRQQGQKDSPLTEEGRQQAKRLTAVLNKFKPDCLYTSPLGRAANTAQIACEQTEFRPIADDRLKETSFGSAEGMTREEIEEKFPGLWDERKKSTWTHRWPEGENYEEVHQRVYAFVQQYIHASSASVIGIIGHESVNRVLVGVIAGLDYAETVRLKHPNEIVFLWQKGKPIQHADTTSQPLKWKPGLLYKE